MNNFTDRIDISLKVYLKKFFEKPIYGFFWKSYWHSLFHKNKTGKADRSHFYIAPSFNHTAGAGHQMSVWASHYSLTVDWGIPFAHSPIWVNGIHSEPDDVVIEKKYGFIKVKNNSFAWDNLLGLGEGEVKASDLIKQGYKKVQLPYFSENSLFGKADILKIMDSYSGQKVVFVLAVDQEHQGDKGEAILFHNKFTNAKARKNDKIFVDNNFFNIAVHIRRGDVTSSMKFKYRDNSYYVNLLNDILAKHTDISEDKIKIYIFSEGKKEDFPEFLNMENVEFCLDMDAKTSFINLTKMDVLAVSPSWFSTIAAAINQKEIYCSTTYRKYIYDLNWIWVDEEGHIG